MIKALNQATRQAFRTLGTPIRFVGNAIGQAAERLIPHGANELGSAMYTGSGYAPPGVTERLTPEHSNVHGTGRAQQAPAQATTQAAPPPTKVEPTQAHTADTYFAQRAADRASYRPRDSSRTR